MGPLAFGSFSATNLAYTSVADMFAANETRAALANQLTGQESPGALSSLHAQDKALTLKKAQADTNYLISQAWEAQLQQLKKRDEERKARMRQNGALYA